LNGNVRFFAPVPLQEIPQLLANADAGVVPKRASDFFGNEAYSTKIMEFMSQGLPAVVSRTRVDTFYYNEGVVRFFESDNVEDLAKALIEVAREQSLRVRLSKNGREFVGRNSWSTQKQAYLELVDGLTTS
jgi:glycosyltransferase involved in cell wall biosynthesis